MVEENIKEFLDFKVTQYNSTKFIESDPIQIPHQFSKKEDIEIIAFIIASIAWGNRKSIIKNGEKLIKLMGNTPHEFILNYSKPKNAISFVHRTFNGIDLDFFFRSLNKIYTQNLSLENLFEFHPEIHGVKGRIINFRIEHRL
jgi:uncharacterized protein (TIGR02757 family)